MAFVSAKTLVSHGADETLRQAQCKHVRFSRASARFLFVPNFIKIPNWGLHFC